VRDVLENVEACDALTGQQLRREGFVLLKRRGKHVAGLHFLPTGALHVQHGRLEHAAEGKCLLRLFLLAASVLLDRIPQVLIEILAKLRKVRSAGSKDPLAVLVVCQRVQQVLERQMGVTPRRCLTIGDSENDF
jgi:hypothetical protein